MILNMLPLAPAREPVSITTTSVVRRRPGTSARRTTTRLCFLAESRRRDLAFEVPDARGVQRGHDIVVHWCQQEPKSAELRKRNSAEVGMVRPPARRGAPLAQPVALAFEGDDVGVVDQSVDEDGGDHRVAEDLAQASKPRSEVTMIEPRS